MLCVILPVLRKLRKKIGFAQISQKKLRKTHCVSCAKVRKKICAKVAQILRNKYSRFVETLLPHIDTKIGFDGQYKQSQG